MAFKIDSADAAGVQPSRGAAGALKYFSAALQTIVTDWWLNMLQNEICNFVTSAGLVLDKAADNQLWLAFQAAMTARLSQDYLYIREEQTAGVDGSATTTSLTAVVLNTVVSNSITGASLSSNQITLPAGTYIMDMTVPIDAAFNGNANSRAVLYNITDASVEVLGSSLNYNTSAAQFQGHGHIFIKGPFTIAAAKVFEVQSISSTTAHKVGKAVNLSSLNEVYTAGSFKKIA